MMRPFRLLAALPVLCCLAACGSSYPADNYEAARQAAQELDWAQSARLIHRHLRDEMDETRRWESWKLLALAQERMGEREWLVETLESMRQEYGLQPEKLSWVLEQLGEAYEAVRDWDKASEMWLQLLDTAELSPADSARLYRHMGRYYQQLHNFELAEDMFIMSLEHADTPLYRAESRYNLACTAYLAGNREKSQALLERLLHMPEVASLRAAAEEGAASALSDSDRQHIAALLGQALLLRGDMREVQNLKAEALADFQEAGRWHPNPEVPRLRYEALKKR